MMAFPPTYLDLGLRQPHRSFSLSASFINGSACARTTLFAALSAGESWPKELFVKSMNANLILRLSIRNARRQARKGISRTEIGF
jgi:hypothetical protein